MVVDYLFLLIIIYIIYVWIKYLLNPTLTVEESSSLKEREHNDTLMEDYKAALADSIMGVLLASPARADDAAFVDEVIGVIHGSVSESYETLVASLWEVLPEDFDNVPDDSISWEVLAELDRSPSPVKLHPTEPAGTFWKIPPIVRGVHSSAAFVHFCHIFG